MCGKLNRRLLEAPACGNMGCMFSLTDYQLRIVMDIAVRLDPERRSVYLERCAASAMLKFRHPFTDEDVADVARLAVTGLAQQPAA
jgi:hypothetical protein